MRALGWARRYSLPEGGVIISTADLRPYPEVTGYWIPTLLEADEEGLARKSAGFLAGVMSADGGIPGPDGKGYFFDTAQVLRGLLAMSARAREFRPAACAAAEYMRRRIADDGSIADDYTDYKGEIPRAIVLFGLRPLREAAVSFDEPRYAEAAEKAAAHYTREFMDLDKDVLTHFLAYMIEGLWENGREKEALLALEEVFRRQSLNGSIRGRAHSWWVCSVGVAQFAVLAYKAGMTDRGDRALAYLCRRQNRSGGFFGSYGWGAKYFPKAEISWANKFFLDAVLLRYGAGILAGGR